MRKPLFEINYASSPDACANKCLVNRDVIGCISEISNYNDLNAENLLTFASFAESIVFSEKTIIESDVILDNDSASTEFDNDEYKIFEEFTREGAIEQNINIDGNFANILDNEKCAINVPNFDGRRIHLIHGSYLVVEDLQIEDASDRVMEGNPYPLKGNLDKYYNEDCKRYLKENGYLKFGYFGDDSLPIPWRLIADCHGVPYYKKVDKDETIRIESTVTNIGLDLFKKLEELNGEFFKEVQQYLGPTYVRIPSIASMVFEKCQTPYDIPQGILEVRSQFEKFRKRCTQLEIDLRNARTIKEQYKIIDEINNSYNAVASKIATTKKRMLSRVFDVVKQIDPLKMATNAIDQAYQYDLERQARIKIPGYYDIWEAIIDVEQPLSQIKTLFPRTNIYDLISDVKGIVKK